MAEVSPLVIQGGSIIELPVTDKVRDIPAIESWLSARETFLSPAIAIESLAVATDKINVTTQSLPIGNYFLDVSYLWNTDATNRDIVTTLLVDGAAVSQDSSRIHVERPKSAGNLGDQVAGTGSGSRIPYFGRFHLNFLSAATHTIQLQFMTRVAGTKASMWDCSIFIHKVDFP